jgi:uncharacterized protein YggU (UPF0235/DUF167 family)
MDIKLQEVISRELKARGESINFLAKACGIPTSTLHNWTQGQLPSAKNLHFIKTLSEYWKLPVSVILFNSTEEHQESSILFSSMFVDQDKKYRLTIEKL